MKRLMLMIVAALSLVGSGLAFGADLEAGSWGGKVRSGPGMNFKQVGSLKNGDPVILLEKTSEFFNGYNWFRISYGKGKTGYQWGGILCAYGTEIDGIFQICDHDNRVRKTAKIDPRHATCDTLRNITSRNSDVPVSLTFVNKTDGQRGVIWISFDGVPKQYASLNPGEKFSINTFLTHPWMFTDGPGNCLEMFMPHQGVPLFEITAPGRNFGSE